MAEMNLDLFRVSGEASLSFSSFHERNYEFGGAESGVGENRWSYNIEKDGSTNYKDDFFANDRCGRAYDEFSDSLSEPSPVPTKADAIKEIEHFIVGQRKELADLEAFLAAFVAAPGPYTDLGDYWKFETSEDDEDDEDE